MIHSPQILGCFCLTGRVSSTAGVVDFSQVWSICWPLSLLFFNWLLVFLSYESDNFFGYQNRRSLRFLLWPRTKPRELFSLLYLFLVLDTQQLFATTLNNRSSIKFMLRKFKFSHQYYKLLNSKISPQLISRPASASQLKLTAMGLLNASLKTYKHLYWLVTSFFFFSFQNMMVPLSFSNRPHLWQSNTVVGSGENQIHNYNKNKQTTKT